MSVFKEFKKSILALGLGAATIVGCSPKEAKPNGGGDTGPGTEAKITEITLGSSTKAANYVVYNATDSTFQIDAGVGNDKSSIKLKPTSNPNAKTIDKDGLMGLLNADNIDISQTIQSGGSALAYLKNKDVLVTISSEGNYIGQGSTVATANNKVTFSQYAGAKDVMVLNAESNGVQKMVNVLTAAKEGKLGFEIIGKGSEKGGVSYNMALIAK